jgi:hypothetical protein
VGFVHDEEGDGGAPEGVERVGAPEAFRGEVEEAKAARRCVAEPAGRLSRGELGVDLGDAGNTPPPEPVHLVLHQRDERRHDDGESWGEKGRQLVAEGFSAAGGQDPEGVASCEEGFHERPLPRAERGVSEQPLQLGIKVHESMIPTFPSVSRAVFE